VATGGFRTREAHRRRGHGARPAPLGRRQAIGLHPQRGRPRQHGARHRRYARAGRLLESPLLRLLPRRKVDRLQRGRRRLQQRRLAQAAGWVPPALQRLGPPGQRSLPPLLGRRQGPGLDGPALGHGVRHRLRLPGPQDGRKDLPRAQARGGPEEDEETRQGQEGRKEEGAPAEGGGRREAGSREARLPQVGKEDRQGRGRDRFRRPFGPRAPDRRSELLRARPALRAQGGEALLHRHGEGPVGGLHRLVSRQALAEVLLLQPGPQAPLAGGSEDHRHPRTRPST